MFDNPSEIINYIQLIRDQCRSAYDKVDTLKKAAELSPDSGYCVIEHGVKVGNIPTIPDYPAIPCSRDKYLMIIRSDGYGDVGSYFVCFSNRLIATKPGAIGLLFIAPQSDSISCNLMQVGTRCLTEVIVDSPTPRCDRGEVVEAFFKFIHDLPFPN